MMQLQEPNYAAYLREQNIYNQSELKSYNVKMIELPSEKNIELC